MKAVLKKGFSRTLRFRKAAATIFALSLLLPLLVFLHLSWRYQLITETEAQVSLLLALLIALLGLVVFQRLADRLSKLAQTVATPKPAEGVTPLVDAEAFGRLLADLRASTERLEDLVYKLGTLNEVAELAARIPKIQDLLAIVLERTMRTVKASIGSIMLLDPERQTLRVVAARGLPEVITGVEVRVGESIAGRVAQLGAPVLVEDIETDPRFAKVNDPKYGSGSFISIPLRVGDRIIGVINLAGKEYGAVGPAGPRSFSPTDLQFLNTLLTHIAYALDNARLLEEARQAAKQLQEVVEDQQLRLTLAQREMLQAAKLAAMGQLLAGVAHELNNPLSVVLGQTALLRQAVGSGALTVRAEKIARAAERCSRIVKNFLALARQHPPERSKVWLNQIVQDAVELLAYPLRVDNVKVRLNLAVDLPVLWADPHQLHQVVVNLITNAHQALRETSSPRQLMITTRFDPAQGRVLLEVADTGPGIPREIRSRIFEPFFTTKPARQGTGLGLSLCQGIIESHGGHVCVESQPGQGAVFMVELPVEAPPAGVSELREAEALPTIRGKAILVVDDEPEITEMLVEMLSVDSHRVETAANGALALDKFRERAYDLILCDVKMPELDGPGLYREVERCHPGLRRRIIFFTGDALSSETREFLKKTAAPNLSKPFAADEIRRVVQKALRTQA